jgi:hypothetical protein
VITYDTLRIHYNVELHATRQSGDCVEDDIVYTGRGVGPTTGDVTGNITTDYRATIYVKEQCQLGLAESPFVITDDSGNSLRGEAQNIFSIARLLEAQAGGASVDTAFIVTGGSGIYEGATGYGECRSITANKYNEDGSVDARADSDCDMRIRSGTAGPAEPLTLRGIGSWREVTVFASPLDLLKTLYVVVLYRNNTGEPQAGLRLRVAAPAGAQVNMSAPGESQVPGGERNWELPDLAPGEVGRFQVNVQVLSASAPTLSLVPEIVGEALGQPFQSEPVTATIVQ